MNQNKIRNELLELGGSLEGIIKELSTAVGAPAPNPRKRVNRKQERVNYYLNLIDARIAKKKNQNKGI